MRQITKISNQTKQQFKFVIDGYSPVTINIQFKLSQYAWFYSLKWGVFELNNEKLVCSLNLLRQFKNIIPFGIFIYHPQKLDPCDINDFTVNGFEFYMLDESDIETVEGYYVKS
jgi:hypothetical protein